MVGAAQRRRYAQDRISALLDIGEWGGSAATTGTPASRKTGQAAVHPTLGVIAEYWRRA